MIEIFHLYFPQGRVIDECRLLKHSFVTTSLFSPAATALTTTIPSSDLITDVLFTNRGALQNRCSSFLQSNGPVASWVECYSYSSSFHYFIFYISGFLLKKFFVIFQSSVIYIKCNTVMQTQNVIHFNSLSDMVQLSSFLRSITMCMRCILLFKTTKKHPVGP